MIEIYYEKVGTGCFWLKYDDHETHVVDHILSGMKDWHGSKEQAMQFCQIAMLHNIFVIQPEELYKAVPHITTITEVKEEDGHG